MMKITHGFIGPRNAQIFSLNNAQILIWPPHYRAWQYLELLILHSFVSLFVHVLSDTSS